MHHPTLNLPPATDPPCIPPGPHHMRFFSLKVRPIICVIFSRKWAPTGSPYGDALGRKWIIILEQNSFDKKTYFSLPPIRDHYPHNLPKILFSSLKNIRQNQIQEPICKMKHPSPDKFVTNKYLGINLDKFI